MKDINHINANQAFVELIDNFFFLSISPSNLCVFTYYRYNDPPLHRHIPTQWIFGMLMS